jgi:hypothetical protein
MKNPFHTRHRRALITLIGVGLVASFSVAPAAARAGKVRTTKVRTAKVTTTKLATTKITFKLDAYQYEVGDEVTGSALVRCRLTRTWVPVVSAPLAISVDGVPIGTATTDAAGWVTTSWTADADGDHIMKVSFAGNAQCKASRRAQGSIVGSTVDPASEGFVVGSPIEAVDGQLEESPAAESSTEGV